MAGARVLTFSFQGRGRKRRVSRAGLLCGGGVEAAGGADGGLGEGFAFGEAMGDFVADDGAVLGVGGFFLIAVVGAAEVEIRAIADVALVLIGPADEA